MTLPMIGLVIPIGLCWKYLADVIASFLYGWYVRQHMYSAKDDPLTKDA